MEQEFIRTAYILGEKNMEKLKKMKIAIFGLGGVGSYVLEGLVRSGILNFSLIDNDIVSTSNINRQIIATHKTVGIPKVLVAKNRAIEINPNVNVKVYSTFYSSSEGKGIIDECDYVVDAIDTVSSKIQLIKEAKDKGIKIISCMGTGNKLDPTLFEVTDIFKTSMCPLCRIMRRELKKNGVENLKVVYSKEPPITPYNILTEIEETSINKKRQTPGSIAFVPSVAGLIIASEVIKDLLL